MDMSRFREALRQGCAPGSLHWATRLNDLGKGDAPAAPDYTPMANASKESAEIMAAQGDRVLEESKRQYDKNMEVAKPVADAQQRIMDETARQGKDYFDYMKSRQRPVEDALNAESMNGATYDAERNAITGQYDVITAGASGDREAILRQIQTNSDTDAQERALLTGGDTGIYDARRDDIEAGVGRAVADARAGQTKDMNSLIRQGMRYGYSPTKMAAASSSASGARAGQIASAANTARLAGIDRARSDLGLSYQMRNATNNARVSGLTNNRAMRLDEGNMGLTKASVGRNLRLQDSSTAWGKKLDVAGLYRGMPGASTGAYSVATGAGNSAVGNTMAPGGQLINGMTSAASITGQGRGMLQSGLATVAGLQSQNYNTALQNDSSGLGGVLGMAKMGLDIYTGGQTAKLW